MRRLAYVVPAAPEKWTPPYGKTGKQVDRATAKRCYDEATRDEEASWNDIGTRAGLGDELGSSPRSRAKAVRAIVYEYAERHSLAKPVRAAP